MLSGLSWLALEAKYLDRARSFYESFFDLAVVRETATEVELAAGETTLVLRRPRSVPRGGVHTHYAFATPFAAYDTWRDRLSASFDLVEETFGDATSLYVYDVDGNCVEIGQHDMPGAADTDAATISGVFEVVLEVADLDRAESFYRDLEFEVMGRGDDRRRVRLTTGPFDLELWEPQLGLADGRGGVHVDLGFDVPDPSAASAAVAETARSVEHLDDGIRVRDPDGHYLTFR
jgi:catechol 2,3-dioxygenase-like lactoylglutathione lyase family enzyme